MGKLGLGCAAIVLLLIVIIGLSFAGTYNTLNRKNQAVNAQWAQVQNVYQRRADLIPNLVSTVAGAANFERSTLQAVVEARSKASSIQATPALVNDPQAFQKFEAAQGQLTSALSRLLVVVERYPELKANQNFRDLQAQLEGTENRIAVERMRFNETAQDYNTTFHSFPTNMIAGMFGFKEKSYFQAQAGAETPPKVNFDFGTSTAAPAPATATATTH
ncbi:MAG: LemA family protein [Thermoanaerobaculia bacterium]